MNPVTAAQVEGAAEGQDVDEKMDEELPVEERFAQVVRKPRKTHTTGALSPRANTRAVPRLVSPLRLVQLDRRSLRSWHPSVEGGAVAAAQRSKGAIAYLAAFLMGQLAAWGFASGELVPRVDQETSLTTLLDEARRAESLVERTAVETITPVDRRIRAYES